MNREPGVYINGEARSDRCLILEQTPVGDSAIAFTKFSRPSLRPTLKKNLFPVQRVAVIVTIFEKNEINRGKKSVVAPF